MENKANGVGPQGGGFHRMPQIPTMNRNVKIAQSKTSAKLEAMEPEAEQGAVIHIEGTDKVIKIGVDGTAETTNLPDSTVNNTEKSSKDQEKENSVEEKGTDKDQKNTIKKKGRRGRPPKSLAKNLPLPEQSNIGTDPVKTFQNPEDLYTVKDSLKIDSFKVSGENTPKSDEHSTKVVKPSRRESFKLKRKKSPELKELSSEDLSMEKSPHMLKKMPSKHEDSNISIRGSSKRESLKIAPQISPNLEESSGSVKAYSKRDACKVSGKNTPKPDFRGGRSLKDAGAKSDIKLESLPKELVPVDSLPQDSLPKCPAPQHFVTKDSQPLNKTLSLDSSPKDLFPKKLSKVTPLINKRASPDVYVSAAGTILPRTVLLRESERPSDSQLARIMEGKTREFDEAYPVKWCIGDLLWGHVSGHPWWPGMISSDPFSGLFTTIKRGPGIARMYHVQYFGDEAERGWVHDKSSLPFEGKQKLLDYGVQQLKTAKGKVNKTKIQQTFSPNPRRRTAWEIAVAEAEDAATLDKEERIDKYTFVYEFLPNKKLDSVDKTKGSSTSPLSNGIERQSTKRKLLQYDSDNSEEGSTPKKRHKDHGSLISPFQPRMHGARDEGSFEVFCAKHRESVLMDHPEYSNTMVLQALRQQWDVMVPQQRVRYKSKFPGASLESMDSEMNQIFPSGSNKRSPRVSRPSLKKLEAEEDKAFTELSVKRPRKNDSGDSTDTEQTSQRSRRSRRRILGPDSAMEDDMTSDGEGNSVKSKLSQESDCSSEMPFPFQDGFHNRGRPLKMEEDYVLEIFKLNNSGPPKKEHICILCEQTGELIECHGLCQNYFHLTCLKLDSAPGEDFKCQECTTGEHTCFSCKKVDKEVKRCSVSQCGKFYHDDCIKKLPQARMEGKGFVCPLHMCTTCAADNNGRNPKAVKGRLYRCVRCPTAYHVGDFCIAAGSVHIAGYHILCSSHFTPLKSQAHHIRINVSWCFSCSKGGSLVCCETCPAAFHRECANLDSMPEDAWYCNDCAIGKRPLYGDIIWIKIGNYRWWPGEICHPRNVPLNIQEKAHQVGEFPVRFFGSHDYYWTHQGRVFLFQEGDRGSKDISACRGLFKMYCKGVNEATEAFKKWKSAKANKEQQEQEKNDRKPAPFKLIKTNIPVGNVQTFKTDLAEIPRCECRPDQDNPCGSDTECLNRMLMYECHPQFCPAKEFCQNQRFQKRQYPECVPYRTESRGWGLKTIEDIKKGQFVNEYVGDLIDEEECKRRIAQAHEENITNFYMLTLDKNRIIDAGPKGNNSRFMNHSCEPNLETQKWTVNGDMRVGLFAIKDIPAGSELTFNYNLECLGNEKTKCACGSANCSGFLGVRPKTSTTTNIEKKKKDKDAKKKKKKKKCDLKKEHEDECFRCGEGGELVMCDKPNCPKVYHLQCLNLAKPPHGKWLCPWHHCDICGKVASKLCTECPNSFCPQHAEGVISLIDDNLVCAEHTDLIEGLTASVSDSTSSPSSTSGDSEDSADSKPLTSDSDKIKEEIDMSSDSEKKSTFTDPVQILPNSLSIDESALKKEIVTVKDSVKVIEPAPLKPSPLPPSIGDSEQDQFKSQLVGEAPLKDHILVPSPLSTKNVCRTKARYKAQLRAGGMVAKPSPPSLPLGSSPNAQPLCEDSDNDSSELVIDIPTN